MTLLPGNFVWISPFNWFDYGLNPDDPWNPDPVTLKEPPKAQYPSSFEYPNIFLRSKNMITLGTPENLQFMAAVQSRRIGAPSGSSPTRTTPLTLAGGPESRKSVSRRSGVSQGTSSRKLRGRRRGRRIIPMRYFPQRLL